MIVECATRLRQRFGYLAAGAIAMLVPKDGSAVKDAFTVNVPVPASSLTQPPSHPATQLLSHPTTQPLSPVG